MLGSSKKKWNTEEAKDTERVLFKNILSGTLSV
jgi:hypothetical protein